MPDKPGRRRRRGDRYDGRLLRSLSPFYLITPYIMRDRSDAQDYYEDLLDVGTAEAWLRKLRDGGRPDIGWLHLFVASLVRTMSQRPRLNRFVAGRRIYARHDITVSIALKKRLHEDALETTIKLRFEPEDTIFDVADRLNAAVEANKELEARNQTDDTARLFMLAPRGLLRAAIALLRFLDFRGLLPRALHAASPFHTSAFITDLGSLGVGPIYHHLYDFGTTSLFVAFGGKQRHRELDGEGRVVERKRIAVKVVNDERICDGHYYASAFKYLAGLWKQPELLESPPERVFEDVD